jgi:hypothetical protein
MRTDQHEGYNSFQVHLPKPLSSSQVGAVLANKGLHSYGKSGVTDYVPLSIEPTESKGRFKLSNPIVGVWFVVHVSTLQVLNAANTQ